MADRTVTSATSAEIPREHNVMEQIGDKHTTAVHNLIPVSKPRQIEAKEDKVTLSRRARAQLLKDRGSSIQEIAVQMNLDVKTVMRYIK